MWSFEVFLLKFSWKKRFNFKKVLQNLNKRQIGLTKSFNLLQTVLETHYLTRSISIYHSHINKTHKNSSHKRYQLINVEQGILSFCKIWINYLKLPVRYGTITNRYIKYIQLKMHMEQRPKHSFEKLFAIWENH